jgi:hypothetical protein
VLNARLLEEDQLSGAANIPGGELLRVIEHDETMEGQLNHAMGLLGESILNNAERQVKVLLAKDQLSILSDVIINFKL